MNAVTGNTNGCGCGCAGQCTCDSQCCELECLVRPNFFCGQLLTDADLAAMVTWTRSRLALARYRDGWGIACGLDLSCSAPDGAAACCGDQAAASGPAVYLNPGYAPDCCGNDLVVCEPLRVDLGSVCRPPDDPCKPHAAPAAAPAVAVSDATTGQADCMNPRLDDLFMVQLSLRYREDLAQGQRAMFRGPCSDDGPCQYARVLEQPCVHLEEVPMFQGRDDRSEEERWHDAFRNRLEREVAALGAAAVKGAGGMLQYIRRKPPYQLCYLEEMVCCLLTNETDTRKTASADLFRIGKLLLVDWLLRELRCPCTSCLPDEGVPLGRVIMRRSVVAGATKCSVVMIDQSAAHRRALRKDACRPIGVDTLDLAPYLWQPASALDQLRKRAMQFNVIEADVTDAGGLAAQLGTFAKTALTFDPESGGSLGVHLVKDIVGTERIAFFLNQ